MIKHAEHCFKISKSWNIVDVKYKKMNYISHENIISVFL